MLMLCVVHGAGAGAGVGAGAGRGYVCFNVFLVCLVKFRIFRIIILNVDKIIIFQKLQSLAASPGSKEDSCGITMTRFGSKEKYTTTMLVLYYIKFRTNTTDQSFFFLHCVIGSAYR